jgi:hypothetical protein
MAGQVIDGHRRCSRSGVAIRSKSNISGEFEHGAQCRRIKALRRAAWLEVRDVDSFQHARVDFQHTRVDRVGLLTRHLLPLVQQVLARGTLFFLKRVERGVVWLDVHEPESWRLWQDRLLPLVWRNPPVRVVLHCQQA